MLPKIIIGGGVLVAVLLSWSMWSRPVPSVTWGSTTIQCLPDGHTGATFHIHSKLTIVVDGVPELIPSHIGDTADCMAEVHTHDASGTVHVEGVEEKQFMLADFYSVWGKEIVRDGYVLRASVKGVAVSDPESITLEEGSEIVLVYTPDPPSES